jgi:ubiquinol-cytochrome c reductase cytochrome c1 subunit
MKRILAAAAAALVLGVGPAASASEAVELPTQNWSFGGVFGTFDRGATQRGFLVYKEVCSACHSLNLLAYRNLTQIGLTPEQVDTIAAGFEVQDGPNDEGDMFTRPARASDTFVSPFPNPQAARAANNGALPPDLSLITKARLGGADYLYALLTGYQDPPPEGVTLMPGMNYNKFFPGHQIGMAPPIADGIVDYPDGTAATTEQIAKDVTTFLSWAAEPELEERKNLGIRTLLFLVVLTALLYALKRKIWQDVH